MKNRLLPLLFVLGSCYSGYSQVVIGKQDLTPSAQLEVYATDKGMLIPRIALKDGSTDVRAITSGNINSLLVFNTFDGSDVKPGYYYWYDNKWNRIVISGEISAGTGNVNFNPVTNQFTYTDASRNSQVVDIAQIVKANETLTTLIKDSANNGKYVYKNERGTETTIDVIGDVITNASSIFNNPTVNTIIKEIAEKTEGSVTFNSTTNTFTYVDAAGNTQIVDISKIVKGNETITTLINNGAGSYTYKNEKGTETAIDVVGDVVTNATSIFNNPTVNTIIKEIAEKTEGSVTFNSTTNAFTYVDAAGNTQIVDISKIVKGNETITTLINNGAGSYTYKNEKGTETAIDVVGDVVTNATSIFNNPTVNTIIKEIAGKTEGSVTFNSTTNAFSYVDAAGNTQIVDISKIVKGNETITTLINNGAGSYTYKNEKGTETAIDVVGDVVTNATSIFNNPTVNTIIKEIAEKTEGSVTFNSTTNAFSYVDAAGNTQIVDISKIVKDNETLTSLVKGSDGQYVYTDEKQGTATIDVVKDVIDNSATIFSNTEVKKEITTLITSDQTVTTLVDNKNGTYLYTSEDKTPTTINVVGDVVTNATSIFNNPAVTNIIKEIAEKTEGSVTFNSTTNAFSYVDAAGNTQIVDISKIVKDNETLTSLVKGSDGQYVYTDEKQGTATIDVVKDVIDNSATIFSNTEVKKEITTLITSDQTVTTLVDNKNGTYLYTSEDKTPTTINVVGDVVTNATSIFNNPAVTNIIKEIAGKTEGAVTFNSTTNAFSYVDAAGNTQIVDISKIVKDNETLTSLVKGSDGQYVYTDEKQGTATIDVVKDVIDNSATIFSNTEVKKEITTLITSDQTVTTLVDNKNGTYLYTSEDKTPTTINVVGDVVTNATSIFNNPAVTNIIKEIAGKTEGAVTFNSTTNAFSYVDAAGNTQIVDISKIVKDNETLTSLVKGSDGQYVYTDEKQGTATIDVVKDVIDNSATIFSNTEVKKEITTLITSDQTVTTLVDNKNGTYLYTSEDKTPTTINVVGDVVTNATSIFNNPAVTNIIKEIAGKTEGAVTFNSTTNAFSYVDAAGNTQIVDISKIVKDNETLTSLVKGSDGQYVYTDEKQGTATIDVVKDVIDNSATIFSNTEVKKEITTLITSDQTVTTLVDNKNGTYLYTSEDKTPTTINVVGDVVTNATSIFNNPAVTNIIKEIAGKTEGAVTFNSTTNAFSYVDAAGNTQIVDISKIVKDNETLTSLVKGSDGQYVYTDEKQGTATIDVVKDVIDNSATIFSNTEVKKEITTLITSDQTVTTLVDNKNGTYLYTSEDKTPTTINVVGDVVTNATSIFNNPAVTNIIKEIAGKTEGAVTFNSTTNAFSYVDAAGNTQIVDISKIVKDNETTTNLVQNTATGVITYTNEKADNQTAVLRSGDSGNILTIGTDGGALLTPSGITAATTVSNTSVANNLTTTVNGVAGPAVPIINSNATSLAGTSLTTTVNGVASTALDLAPALAAGTTNVLSLSGNTLTSNVNGMSSTSDAVSAVSNASTVNTSTVTVNGVTSMGAPIINSAILGTSGKTLSATINGVASNAIDLTSAIAAGETITTMLPVVTTGNTIATYTNEAGGAPVNIKETVTSLVHNPTGKTLTFNGENNTTSIIGLKDITTTTPATVLEVTGLGATFAAATVNIVPSTVKGDVLTTNDAGLVEWKAPLKTNVMGIKLTSNNYAVNDDDYTIIANKLTTDITITLPDATTNKGRLLIINQFTTVVPNQAKPGEVLPVKVNFNTVVKYSDVAEYSYLTTSAFGGSTNGTLKVTLQSDGTNWYAISATM